MHPDDKQNGTPFFVAGGSRGCWRPKPGSRLLYALILYSPRPLFSVSEWLWLMYIASPEVPISFLKVSASHHEEALEVLGEAKPHLSLSR